MLDNIHEYSKVKFSFKLNSNLEEKEVCNRPRPGPPHPQLLPYILQF